MSTRPQTPLAIDGPRSATMVLLQLALPMIGMTLARMLMGFIDFVMVSRLGTEAQAAISPATLLIFAIGCLGMGTAQSVQTFVSQADGRGEPERAGAYAWQSLILAGIWAVLTLPLVLYTGVWYRAFGEWAGKPADVLELEIAYLVIAFWSLAPAVASAGLDSFYNGIKRPMIPLVAVIASLVVNLVGNYLLIFGALGFPRMGIAGAALATVIGWAVRMAVMIVPLLWASIDARYHTWHNVRLRVVQLGEILRIGMPIAMQWLVDIGAWVVFLHMMMPPFGTATLAASNIVVQYMHLSFMPALGIGMALTTQVGNAIGAGRPDEAFYRLRIARRVIVVYMGLMAGLFVLAGAPLAGVFSDDATVIAVAGVLMIWAGLFQISDGLCIAYSFALRGAGDTRRPALLFLICCWGIFVAGGLAAVRLAPGWGSEGPWGLCALYIIVLGFLLMARFHGGAWRSIRVFAGAAAPVEPPAEVVTLPGRPAPLAAEEAVPVSGR